MSKTLYLECSSGISGDMSVAALLDLGADKNALLDMLDKLPFNEYRIEISRVDKAGISCLDFNIIMDEDNHDHDMEYLHGHADNIPDKGHVNEHSHAHEHRNLGEILRIIEQAEMSDNAKQIAVNIFTILAQAESKAHNVPVEEVHFHEVGAVDSIVDVLSFAFCYDNLGITDTVVEVINEGGGTVRCRHGILPVPVPAVVNILADCGIAMHKTGISGELITPTGAAIAAAICTKNKLPEQYVIRGIGLGAGKRNYETPSILRAMLIEEKHNGNHILRVETDIDDCSAEVLGYTMERLYETGAREVHYSPVYMKKNRPAYELVVICTEDKLDSVRDIIFRETTSIGLRYIRMERSILERHVEKVQTSLGEALVKKCEYGSETYFYPEYDSVKELALKNEKSFLEVYGIISNEAKQEK